MYEITLFICCFKYAEFISHITSEFGINFNTQIQDGCHSPADIRFNNDFDLNMTMRLTMMK